MSGPHILGTFDDALADLRLNVLDLGRVARTNLELSITGLLRRETSLCEQVIAKEKTMKRLASRADNDAIEIITRFQPVASDLRFVLTSLKVAYNLERIANHVVKIAKRTPKILQISEVSEVNLLEPLFSRSNDALSQAILAYNDRNPSLVSSLSEDDEEIDQLYKKARKTFTSAIEETPAHHKELIHLMFVARSLERIGDHAVHIAETLQR